MKPRILLGALPFVAMALFACTSKADAFDVGFGVGFGGHHHGHVHGGVEFRTVDPGYTTWYPAETESTYTYGPYYSGDYYGTTVAPYNYTVVEPSVGVYTDFYGGGRSRHHWHHH